MADTTNSAEAEKTLWKQMEDQRVGMLGVVGGKAHHFQPMTPFVEADSGTIWFFCRDDNDLIAQSAEGKAMLVIQADRFQACIGGKLSPAHDRARIDKFWNAIVAAWYPQGKDDPHLTLLRFDCEDAEMWISQANPIRFAFEIAKANLTGSMPDLGDKTSVNLT